MNQPTENPTTRAVTWQHRALLELIDMASHLILDRYEGPQDFGEELALRSKAIATLLDPSDRDQLPTILDAVGSHVFALQLASEQIAQFTGEKPDQIVGRLQLSGFDYYQSADPMEVAAVTSDAIAAMQAVKVRGWVPTEGMSHEA